MKKNLILFYPSFERGGVEKIIENIIIKNTKFNLHVISSRNINSVVNLKKNKAKLYPVIYNKSIPFIPQRFLSAFSAMKTLSNTIDKIKGRIVIHSMQSNIAALLICLLKKKKIIIRNSENPIYSSVNSENKITAFFIIILKFLFYSFADGVITNSKGSAKSLSFFIFNKKKIKHIYNPYLQSINKQKFKKDKLIINIGRLRKQKDHKNLLLAFKLFLEKNRDYKLLILGDGNLKQNLKEFSKKLEISKKVKFKGWVKNTIPYLKKSKIFVLSSSYEGLGNVLIDAINYNVPCVSTNCPSGPSEILLNGQGGFLVKTKSPELLADAMNNSIRNYTLSLKKNNLAKKKLDRFLISKNIKDYLNYLNNF